MEQVKACWTHPCLLACLFSKCHLKVLPLPPSSSCPQFYPSFRRQPSAAKPQCGSWLAACIQQLLCSKFWASYSYPDSHLSYVFCLSCSTASWARRTTNWPAWTGCQHCSTVSLLSPVVCGFPPSLHFQPFLIQSLWHLPSPPCIQDSNSACGMLCFSSRLLFVIISPPKWMFRMGMCFLRLLQRTQM